MELAQQNRIGVVSAIVHFCLPIKLKRGARYCLALLAPKVSVMLFQHIRTFFDRFTIILIAVVVVATVLPATDRGALLFHWLTNFAITLLFFMHGAKLSRGAIVAGLTHWRLHILVFACTFLVFPLLGVGLRPVIQGLVGEPLAIGIVFLCVLPGTVQSAIAFTSLAKGNVPAAICSASASSILGIVLTPLLVALLLGVRIGTGASLLDAILAISLELLVPFIAGHLSRPLIGAWIDRHRDVLGAVDQSSILLVVYTAMSASVVEGLWTAVDARQLIGLGVICCILLALILGLTSWLGRYLGFNREDRITIVFCGSKKSLANGVPMASVLFAGAMLGPALLPLMIFHQLQLMVCAVMAQRYARHADASG